MSNRLSSDHSRVDGISILVGIQGTALLIGAIAHTGIALPLGVITITEPRIIPAVIVEGVTGTLLLGSAAAIRTRKTWARRACIIAQTVALGGVLLGIAAISLGAGPHTPLNAIFHRVMVVLLLFGLALILLPSAMRSFDVPTGGAIQRIGKSRARAVETPRSQTEAGGGAVSRREVFQVLAAWLGSSLIIGYATYVVLPVLFTQWAGDISRLSAVIVAEVYFLFIAVLVVAMGGIEQMRSRLSVGRPSRRETSTTAVLWMAAYGISFVGYALASSIVPAFPSPAELVAFLLAIGTDMGRLDGADFGTTVIVLVRACIMAPVAEELLFRGVIFAWIRNHLSAWPTITITAVAFAGIHGMMSGTMLLLAFGVGMAAGIAREHTNSVTPVIIVHVLQNVIVMAIGVTVLL